MSNFEIHQGNALDVLKDMRSNSVHCVVCSPPYWGLRAYGTEPQIWANDQLLCEDEHEWIESTDQRQSGAGSAKQASNKGACNDIACAGFCVRCGAWRGELGLEPTPELFIEHLVQIFREVWRILREDGTCFINIGDSYNSKPASNGISFRRDRASVVPIKRPLISELKEKDLCMIPAQLAIALRSNGWWLRQEIVWSKLNVMPESVTDRCTRSHEMVYMLTKSARYFYDTEAIREDNSSNSQLEHNLKYAKPYAAYDSRCASTGQPGNVNNAGIHSRPGRAGRNRRSVWTIPTESFSEPHFATYPRKLAELCVKSGSSEKGCCVVCGSPYKRILEPTPEYAKHLGKDWSNQDQDNAEGRGHFELSTGGRASQRPVKRNAPSITAEYLTVGWRATCSCFYGPAFGDVAPCTVLDPFAGAGTTLLVATRLGRHGIGIELNPAYIAMAERRIRNDAPLFNEGVIVAPLPNQPRLTGTEGEII